MVGPVVLMIAWSLFVGLNHTFGAMSQHHNVLRAVRVYADGQRTAGDFFDDLWAYSRFRHVVERLT